MAATVSNFGKTWENFNLDVSSFWACRSCVLRITRRWVAISVSNDHSHCHITLALNTVGGGGEIILFDPETEIKCLQDKMMHFFHKFYPVEIKIFWISYLEHSFVDISQKDIVIDLKLFWENQMHSYLKMNILDNIPSYYPYIH